MPGRTVGLQTMTSDGSTPFQKPCSGFTKHSISTKCLYDYISSGRADGGALWLAGAASAGRSAGGGGGGGGGGKASAAP